MHLYKQSTDRGFEIFIGIILAFVAFGFIFLTGLILTNAPLSITFVLSSITLVAIATWFGKLSYRLILNKPRETGGLLSPSELKIACVVIGLILILSILQNEPYSILSVLEAVLLMSGCVYGWKLANERKRENKITKPLL